MQVKELENYFSLIIFQNPNTKIKYMIIIYLSFYYNYGLYLRIKNVYHRQLDY